MLMTAGERISMSLLAMAIHAEGASARSFTGQQAGFFTDARYGAAHIKSVKPDRVKHALEEGDVAIVAGFQGINANGDATTLGRGGCRYLRSRFGLDCPSVPICARSTPMWMAFSPPIRASSRPPSAFPASTTIRFLKWPHAVRRCLRCAASNTPSVSTCRCMCVRPSPTGRHAGRAEWCGPAHAAESRLVNEIPIPTEAKAREHER